jgi:hypothetical protein
MVSGNHDVYTNPPSKNYKITRDNTIDAIHAKIKAFFKETSKKLHYLNNSTLKLTVNKKNYLIIGSTLWSYIPEAQQERIQNVMSDYNYIYVNDAKTNTVRKLRASDVTAMFNKNYRYIKTQISKADPTTKVIIFSHHCPFITKTYNVNEYDPAYVSDCSELFIKPVVAWCFGHTHQKTDCLIKGVRFYSLPKGYPRQHCNFDKTAIIKI